MANTSANIEGDLRPEEFACGNQQRVNRENGKSVYPTKSEYDRVFNELAAFLYKQYRNKKQQEQIDETLEAGLSQVECC